MKQAIFSTTPLATHHVPMLILRLVFGGYMAVHGWPKVMKIFNGDFEWVDPLGIGEHSSLVATALGEALFPALVLVGFLTRVSCVPVILTMLTGLLLQHWNDPWIFWHDPMLNLGGGLSKEQPILYATVFTVILIMGPGKYSIDGWREQKRQVPANEPER